MICVGIGITPNENTANHDKQIPIFQGKVEVLVKDIGQ